MLTLNQYILLDPILLFFISGATYAMSKFRNLGDQEFTFKWYFWLSLMGAFIGCAFSVKFVGLFVILLIGINTIAQLWDIMGDLSKPFTHTIKHFLARAFCLIALPIVLYITFFYIHLSVLYKSWVFISSFCTDSVFQIRTTWPSRPERSDRSAFVSATNFNFIFMCALDNFVFVQA